MDSNTLKKIEDSRKEIDKVLNFLEGSEYNDPESSILVKAGREDFFKDFYEEDTVYHIVDKWDQHQLKVYMLIPKGLKIDQKVPFHVLFHGGGLTTGGGNYVHWFCDYKLDLAIKANAITLIPMYRLMPEDRGAEIEQDVINWWNFYENTKLLDWVQKCLGKHGLNIKPEMFKRDELLISGESAGGMLTVFSWLNAKIKIRALYLQYPMLKYYEKKVPSDNMVIYMGKKIPYAEVERRATELIEVADEQRKAGRSVSRSDTKPPIGMPAAMLLSNTKKWGPVFRDGKDIKDIPRRLAFQMECKLAPHSFPKVFIVHGMEDSAVPFANTVEFVENVERALGQWGCTEKVEFLKMQGRDHAFDYVTKGQEFEGQIQEMMKSVIAAWTG